MREAGSTEVQTEKPLIPVSGEKLNKGAIIGDDARMDIVASNFWDDPLIANNFWGKRRHAHFDVRICNPYAPSHVKKKLDKLLAAQEKEKRTAYAKRTEIVEHAHFTPLVFTTTGACGTEANAVIKRLGLLISRKTGERYEEVVSVIRTKLSISLLESSIRCFRGCREKKKARLASDFETNFAVECADLRIPN